MTERGENDLSAVRVRTNQLLARRLCGESFDLMCSIIRKEEPEGLSELEKITYMHAHIEHAIRLLSAICKEASGSMGIRAEFSQGDEDGRQGN